MFANKILNTMSPGGKRLGLIYVSSDVDTGTPTYFEISGFLQQNDVNASFKYFPEDVVYLSLFCAPNIRKEGYRINGWYPLILIEKDIIIKLNNKILNTNNLPVFNDGRFKGEYVTCTLRGWDSSTMSKQYYIVSVDVSDVPQTETYYDISDYVDENNEVRFLIGSDKGKFYIDKENNLEISKPVKLYYTDIDYGNFKMEQNSPYLAGSLATINVNGVNKHALKINFTDSGYLSNPDYWEMKSELEANNFVFNNKYEVNQMKVPYRYKEVFFGLYSAFNITCQDRYGNIEGFITPFLTRYTDEGGSFTGDVQYPPSISYHSYNNVPFYSISGNGFTLDLASMTLFRQNGISSQSVPIYYVNNDWEESEYLISGLHLIATDSSS